MTHPNTRTRTRLGTRTNRSDEGSLLMALMFTMLISALSLAIMVSVMTGLKKTDNTRAFALAQQASDIALADALMHANMRLLTTSPATNTGVTGNINWSWTATQTSPADWTIDVEARGKAVDRHFRSTLSRTPVIQGTWSDTNTDGIRDNIRYTAKNNRPFGSGFYGVGGVYLSPYPLNAAFVDGYNGGRGMVGTSGNTDLGAVDGVDIINLWNWKPTDDVMARCQDCLDYYPDSVRKFEQDFQRDPVATCTGPNQSVNWRASSGVPLANGDCYNSLTFDVDYHFAPATPTEQAWISSNSDVTINPGVNVGANRTTTYTKATSWVIAIKGGEFTLDNGAMFSGAVYSPHGVCKVIGSATTQPTTWLGASVCDYIDGIGKFRLRYDGGMASVERPGDTTTGPGVWALRDFQIVD